MILNNLFERGFTWLRKAGIVDSFRPMIIIRDKKVEVSYAGPGGFLSRSLDIPRMINSLTLFLHFGTNIREASTTPLIFPFLDDHSDYFEGFTWTAISKLHSAITGFWRAKRAGWLMPLRKITGQGTRRSRPDTAAVVQVLYNDEDANATVMTPFYFNDEEDYVMPSGV